MRVNTANRLSAHILLQPWAGLLWTLLMVMVSLLITPASLAQEASQRQGTIDWHYTLRPSDTIHKVAQQFLSPRYTVSDLARYNQLNDLGNLSSGSIINIPIKWLRQQPQAAVAMSVSGYAVMRHQNHTGFNRLQPGSNLSVGDEIVTRQGSVLIRFADKSILRLSENSNLVFNRLTRFGKTGMVDTRVRLQKGHLFTSVKPLSPGARYEINTPSAVAAVRGTEFRLAANSKSTTLEVTRGTVQLTHASGSLMVPAGHGAKVHAGNPLVEQTLLALAPTTNTPQKTAIDFPVNLKWSSSTPAQQYHYQLYENDIEGKLVRSLSSPSPELTLDSMPNGKYLVVASTLDQNGFESLNSVTELNVSAEAKPASLLLPDDRARLTTPFPEFSWTLQSKGELAKLEISKSGDFSAPVFTSEFSRNKKQNLESRLPPGDYLWRVKTTLGGDSIAESEVRKLTILGKLESPRILTIRYANQQIGLHWNKVDGVKDYLLQLSDDPLFSNVLKEETISRTYANLKINPGRRYFARVKGLGTDYYDSDYGPAKELYLKP